MLAALNIGALALGVASGGLLATFVALLFSGLLSVIGVEGGSDIGLVIGVTAGLFVGGWIAGSRSAHSHRFHGMVTGLLLAFVIMAVARFGGSPAGAGTILWLALLSLVIAGAGGWMAGRRLRPSSM